MKLKIPTIDISQLAPYAGLLSANSLDANTIPEELIQTLSDACEQWGFFQLQGHGLDPALRQKVFHQAEIFFALPATEKKKLERSAGNFWGYYDKELTKNKQDWKEILIWTVILPIIKTIRKIFLLQVTRNLAELLGQVSCLNFDQVCLLGQSNVKI